MEPSGRPDKSEKQFYNTARSIPEDATPIEFRGNQYVFFLKVKEKSA